MIGFLLLGAVLFGLGAGLILVGALDRNFSTVLAGAYVLLAGATLIALSVRKHR